MRRRGIGGPAYVVMAGAMFAIPVLATWPSWNRDESKAAAGFEYKPLDVTLKAEKVEAFATEGFDALAAEIRSRPEDPSWEEVRRVMERRKCTGLRYVLKVRCFYSDGNVMDRTVLRHPYDEPKLFPEFLRYLRDGPEAAAGAVLNSPAPPQDC